MDIFGISQKSAKPVIRVAFRYGDPRWFARLVCFLRGGDSAHCEGSEAWDLESGLHECISSSWLDGGVRAKVMRLPADKWRVYEIEANESLREWLVLHEDFGYDVRGLFGILFPPIGHKRLAKFCSEALAGVIGLPEPHIYDLRALEGVCVRFGKRIQ